MSQSIATERLIRKTKSLPELLVRRVAESGDREAYRFPVADEWRSLTWRAAGDRAMAIAGGLCALGVKREERVAILSQTRLEWMLVDLGILCGGAATTTVYPSTPAEECAFILTDSASRVVFVEDVGQLAKLRAHRSELSNVFKVVLIDGSAPSEDGDWVMTLEALEAQGQAWLKANPKGITDVIAGIEPEHLATLIYTSGTTGKPKGVRLVHECWAYEADAMDALGLAGPDDVQFLWLPMSHSFGKVLMALHVVTGSVCAVDGRIPKIVENLAVVRPTFMAAAPRIFEKVYNKVVAGVKEQGGLKEKIFNWSVAVGKKVSAERQAGREPTGLLAFKNKLATKLVFSKLQQRFGGRVKFFISGSAPLSREIAEFFHACGILILEGYGLTESSAATFVNRPSRYAFGSVGVPLPGTQVKLAPEDKEILIKGPGIMRGYHNLAEATAETLSGEGWLHTGDIGEIDDKGFLRITDRKKDLIKTSGGKYIAPQSIEGKFKTVCPYISQVIVHGDRRNFVTALLTLDEEAITKWARDNGKADKSYTDLASSAEAEALIKPYVDQVNTDLAKYETVKKFAILPTDLTIDAGELTPSLKVKRKVVEKKYMHLLDKMYEGSVADM